MSDLSLGGQAVERDDVNPKLVKLKNLMDQRKDWWKRIGFDKRKTWVLSGEDPIIDIAWDIYNYLDTNFFGRRYYDSQE
jgi:hypothetical protein